MKWNWILDAKRRHERETLLARPAGGGRLSAVLAYPDTYFTGMSNLGFQAVWSLFNRELGISCERAFYPDQKYASYFRSNGNLRSLETQKPLHEFGMICFSASFETNYPMLVDMLGMTAVPARSRDRGDGDPLVILGGAVSCLNTEPVADFIDAVVIGRAEDSWPEIAETIERSSGRLEALGELSRLDNVIVPSLMRPRDARRKGSSRRFFSSSIMTGETEFADTVLTEIMRGCPFGCRFCTVSNCFGQCMFRPAGEMISELEGLGGGVRKIGLIGGSINAHPEFGEILSYLRSRNLKVGFSSLRADRLTNETLDFIMREGGKTLTLAPETANEKRRFLLGKRITDDAFMESAEMAFAAGIENLRLYFMTGLPGETAEEAAGTGEMIGRLRSLKGAGRAKISVSVSQFVPKPFTPLEREGQNSPEEAERKLAAIRGSLPKGVKMSGESPGAAALQGVLARGGRSLSAILSASPGTSYGKWRRLAEKAGIDLDGILSKKGEDEELPWR